MTSQLWGKNAPLNRFIYYDLYDTDSYLLSTYPPRRAKLSFITHYNRNTAHQKQITAFDFLCVFIMEYMMYLTYSHYHERLGMIRLFWTNREPEAHGPQWLSWVNSYKSFIPDLYLSPAESPNFGVQEKPLTFMLSKHFWRFTSVNLNTLIRHLIIQPFSCCKQLVSSVFSCV